LFVSHNMAAVEELCDRVVWLEQGRVATHGYEVGELCRKYLFGGANESSTLWVSSPTTHGSPYFDPQRVSLENEDGELLPTAVPNNAAMYLVIQGEVTDPDPSLIIGYTVIKEDGQTVYWSAHRDAGQDHSPKIVKGRNKLRTRIPSRFLNEGTYTIEVFACLHNQFWVLEPGKSGPAVTLTIAGGMSDSLYWYARRPGVTAPVMQWETADETATSVAGTGITATS
jgi:lipopolysaccharide transport system ATP-binding protein